MSVDLQAATQRARARLGSFVKGKWRLDSLLGVGGMASVYAATHRNNKRAALKILHPEYSHDAGIRRRFLREGYLANSIGHSGIVVVDDDDVTEDGAVFLVMELLDGETLAQRLRRKGRLPLGEVLAAADQVLDALAAAHAAGVIHRDLKPENLFLTREGAIKLLDFGVGRLRELNGVLSSTVAGETMGTPAFMAPEQARGRWEEVDARTDLWAFGATLFTLLTGEYVHEGRTVNETLALAASRRARAVGTLRPDLPERAAAFVDRALAYQKNERFADARAMRAEARAIHAAASVQDLTEPGRPPMSPGHSSPAAAPPALDARWRASTVRPFWASRLPDPPRSAWSSLSRRSIVLLTTGAGLVVFAALWPSRAELSVAPPAAIVAAGPTKATSRIEPAPAASSDAVAVPTVSIEDLPRESLEKSAGPKTALPRKSTASLARRR